MNNEIKEIFDIKELFKEWKQFLKWCYENNDKTVEIHRDKLKWTMDYITNLQEENKKLNNIIDELEKYLNNEINEWEYVDDTITRSRVEEDKEILNKLKELKGEDKDE